MMNISRLETRFQEIVFLLTIVLSLTVAVGGIFFLKLSPENFIIVSGAWGSQAIEAGFRGFGYTYFCGSILMLHMGHLILTHASDWSDLLRLRMVFLRSFLIYFSILLLLSSFISVLEAYKFFEVSKSFAHGGGGWFGRGAGGFLFKNFGLMGSMIFLFSLTSIIGIAAGFMEIVHSFYVMREIIGEFVGNLIHKTPKTIASVGQNLADFVDHETQYATAGAMDPVVRRSAPLPQWHKTGNLRTDQFHIYGEKQAQRAEAAKEQSLKDQRLQAPPMVTPAGLDDQETSKGRSARKTVRKTATKSKAKTKAEEQPKEAPVVDLEEGVPTPEELAAKKLEVSIPPYRKRYKKIEISVLDKPEKTKKKSEQEMIELTAMVEERLESFGLKGEIIRAHQGVTLTMFEFKPSAGVKLSKIQSHTDDLALVLGAKSIRVLTPIPGKTTVGFEIPNVEIGMLRFSEMVPTMLKSSKMELPVALGVDVYNKTQVADLAKMPHVLISGTTGSGKSVFMNTLISGLIFHKSPKDLRFIMIDPKMIELSPYNGIPHLLKPVVTDVDEAKELLLWAESEMDRRYQIFSDMQSKSITTFNASVKKGSKKSVEGRLGRKIDWTFEAMPYIVIVVDEMADLMLTQGKEVERPITRIAQKARACGIHLVMATQRPSSDIVTGLIKTNFPTRVSFKVSSGIDSRTIIDQSGAEKLLGNGDMLYLAQGKPIERLQGSYISEDEVKKVVRLVTAQKETKTKAKSKK